MAAVPYLEPFSDNAFLGTGVLASEGAGGALGQRHRREVGNVKAISCKEIRSMFTPSCMEGDEPIVFDISLFMVAGAIRARRLDSTRLRLYVPWRRLGAGSATEPRVREAAARLRQVRTAALQNVMQPVLLRNRRHLPRHQQIDVTLMVLVVGEAFVHLRSGQPRETPRLQAVDGLAVLHNPITS